MNEVIPALGGRATVGGNGWAGAAEGKGGSGVWSGDSYWKRWESGTGRSVERRSM